MNNEQTWIDPRCTRSEWGPGDWDGEPDKVQWTDTASGLICLAKRNPESGNWCGYVGVSGSHPWHGKGCGDVDDVDVHGGLTFADKCQEGAPEQTICHIPAPGEPDHLWWFGFDCHHAWDLAPGTQAFWRKRDMSLLDRDSIYRPLSYVKDQCAGLAAQIKAAA